MKVLKFGGTSVGSVENIRRVKEIVSAISEPAVVVVSAVGGITDKLIATTTQAVAGTTTYTTQLENIVTIHQNIIAGVVPANLQAVVSEQVMNLLDEIKTILTSLEGIQTISPKDMDLVVSYGERMSSIIMAAVLDAQWFNSLELIKTQRGQHKNALNQALTYSLLQEKMGNLPQVSVMGGFISPDSETGEISNLGRGGSDYTAAIVAAALGASVLEIWTDVDGFLTADPRLVKNAYTIDELSYIEAVELSNFGAKVIY
ncbi:MAG: aspartate kinase, partial [Paludibacteraceae bacterium]|nr:aspartate kinase [Paludibacteraceae bacterium]